MCCSMYIKVQVLYIEYICSLGENIFLYLVASFSLNIELKGRITEKEKDKEKEIFCLLVNSSKWQQWLEVGKSEARSFFLVCHMGTWTQTGIIFQCFSCCVSRELVRSGAGSTWTGAHMGANVPGRSLPGYTTLLADGELFKTH